MISKEIRTFPHGVIDALEPQDIPVGSFASALNFITLGDHVEIRRGSAILGTDGGAGSMAGLGVGTKLNGGEQVLFRKVKGQRKFEYYDEDLATPDWAETGTDAAPTASNSDDFAFASYDSQAGSQAFWSSPLSSIYKIMVANPASITDLLSTIYRGYIKIKQSRTFLWNRNSASGSGPFDEQNVYVSYIDNRQFTTVTAEATTSLSGTLAFKAAGAKRTCFGVKITLTVSGEVFTDNRDGTLTGTLGSTGTINYTTGAYTLSIAGVGTVDYQWEDTTNQGIADFSFSSPRTAGQGDVFLQGDGGNIEGIGTYGDTEYCMHTRKTYALRLSDDDTAATNLLFRDREGIPHWRALKDTSIGIFYVSALEPSNAKLKLLTTQEGSTAVEGKSISDKIDLSGYRFDDAFVEEWDDYIIVGCRTSDSTTNNRFILYHKVWQSFDFVDYWGRVAVIYNGALVIGESISKNAVTVFSGVDDDNSVIDAVCEFNEWDLEYPGWLKKVKKLQVEGNIGPSQRIGVYVKTDHGTRVKLGTIDGDGTYVDRSQRVTVGSQTLGRGEVAGGSDLGSDDIEAYHYFREIDLRLDKFERWSIIFEREDRLNDDLSVTQGIGYFGISTIRAYDIRLKNQKLPRKYRA